MGARLWRGRKPDLRHAKSIERLHPQAIAMGLDRVHAVKDALGMGTATIIERV